VFDDQEEAPRRRLSEREGRAKPRGPFEGVPGHLEDQLAEWLKSAMDSPWRTEESLAKELARTLLIEKLARYSWTTSVLFACRRDEELFLDALDHTLLLVDGYGSDDLQHILTTGQSVWEVNERRDGLRRRVPRTEQAAYDEAASADDDISNDLREAWSKVYGLHPDPSDAWGHAIRAVERALGPIVTPNDNGANLGSIAGELGGQSSRFAFGLATSSKNLSNVETLAHMLRLMWPNPDRHGTGNPRTPSLAEAKYVVQLAVLVVGWVRSGALTRRSR